MIRIGSPACALLAILLLSCCDRAHYPVAEKTAAQISADLAGGKVTAAAVTEAHLARIKAIDPNLHAVLALNPKAVAEARVADRRGALSGLPVLIKDNIDVRGIPTTAGSLALVANIPTDDAPVVANLRAAGAVILGKANLSEWANFRDSRSSSGWSAVGGLTRNPYDATRTACGSSSGSAVAVTVGLAPLAVGTETDGSIVCPASMNGIVGLKPTVELISQVGIVPVSHSQDTAGPMARTVRDAAMLLTAMVGKDLDYAKSLDPNALSGARLGVMRFLGRYPPATLKLFQESLDRMEAAGAVLVNVDALDFASLKHDELVVLLTEFKAGLGTYLAKTPPAVKVRSLADVIAFNRAEPRELAHFGQDMFELAELTPGRLDDPSYIAYRDRARRRAGPDGIDHLLKTHDVVALLAPTTGPAWPIDLGRGDAGGGSAAALPAIAGYPHLTVPMGEVAGLPAGLSFIGPAWSEALLLSLGFAFEDVAKVPRRSVPVIP